MKKLSVSTLALVAALVAAPVVAHADATTPGWYVGAGVGATFGQDPHVHFAREHSIRDEDVNLDALANGGYAWNNGLRVEGEYFHNQINQNHLDSFSGAGGHITNNALFANVLYDFQNSTMFTPYVGVGAGPDFVNVKSEGANGIGFLKGDTTTLGYQGIAGVATTIDQNWAITADYRYIGSTDAKVDRTTGGQGRTENASHNIIVGVRYSFGEPTYAPTKTAVAPMVAPHRGAKPAVAAVPQDFVVFFDFNKATLTAEGKRIIASAAQEFKKGNFVHIAVTGHTDTVGTAAYNEKLSQKRAAAVKAELAKLGVSGSSVTEQGVGKNDLMVPTADGVREAQNRRAEIVLSK